MTLKPWSETALCLINVAMGREYAETVVKNAKWVNVHSGEIIPATDIAITHGRFAYVGPDASHTIGPNTKTIDAAACGKRHGHRYPICQSGGSARHNIHVY
jgi:adenine deaminase